MKAPPSRAGAKTPTATGTGTLRRAALPATGDKPAAKSPSRIPARAPLSHLNHGGNSPERHARNESTIRGKMGPPPSRAPPPKMRNLYEPPPAPTPITHFRSESVASSGSVRHVSPEDNFYDGNPRPRQQTYMELKASMRSNERDVHSYPSAPSSRQISNTSSHTTVSGSENWQTIEDDSEPERDASEAYYAKLRATHGKRYTPEDYPQSQPIKKPRGLPPHARPEYSNHDGVRIASGSEANWTDEDAF